MDCFVKYRKNTVKEEEANRNYRPFTNTFQKRIKNKKG